jgi:hypothetical protein
LDATNFVAIRSTIYGNRAQALAYQKGQKLPNYDVAIGKNILILL